MADDEESTFVIEKATNARAKCANKPCNEKIEKGTLRIGLKIFFFPTKITSSGSRFSSLLFFRKANAESFP